MRAKRQMRITVDEDMYKWLEAGAKRRRVSMSLIIRELLLEAMPEEAKNPE